MENGPQVGNIIVQKWDGAGESAPYAPSRAGSQEPGDDRNIWSKMGGQSALKRQGVSAQVASIVTQVEVDADDNAFKKPSKPVACFFLKQNKEVMAEKGEPGSKTAVRGWRRVVPSPHQNILLKNKWFQICWDVGSIVVSAGGGAYCTQRKWWCVCWCRGSHRQGFGCGSWRLILMRIAVILTDVSNAMLNYKREDEKKLKALL